MTLAVNAIFVDFEYHLTSSIEFHIHTTVMNCQVSHGIHTYNAITVNIKVIYNEFHVVRYIDFNDEAAISRENKVYTNVLDVGKWVSGFHGEGFISPTSP